MHVPGPAWHVNICSDNVCVLAFALLESSLPLSNFSTPEWDEQGPSMSMVMLSSPEVAADGPVKVFFFFLSFFLFLKIFIYLAVPGLSCGMRDLVP